MSRWLARLVDRDTDMVTEEVDLSNFTEDDLNEWYFGLLRTGTLATHRLEYPSQIKENQS